MTRINTQPLTAINPLRTETSTISIVCRICYDSDRDEELITPCNCKGTVAFVHRSCLEIWLGESNTTKCELCHYIFKTERMPKFTTGRSIRHWCRYAPGGCTRGIRSDILACTVITPLAIVITYICLFSAEYYSQKKFISVPAARWTSLSLLIMIVIMLIGYYLWTYSVIRMHARLWYNWWQRTCDVRYIPASETNITVDTEQIPVESQSACVNDSDVLEVVGNTSTFTEVESFQTVVDKRRDASQNIELSTEGSEFTIVSQDLAFDNNIV